MTLTQLQERLRADPAGITFAEVMALIDSLYHYTPTALDNGLGEDRVSNAAGTNEGSCRLFAFARLQGFDAGQTLACFGAYYREDVLGHPAGRDHANIRSFMRHGWAGIRFHGEALRPRAGEPG